MKAVFVSLVLGVLLCAPIGIARAGDSSVPADPVFRTGFENSSCANGILEDGEQCEDRSSADGDGCSSKCQVEPGFQCTGLPSACQAVCGDGLIVAAESCDQGGGNVSSGDGCSSSCQQESGYQCTGLPSACEAVCGDGVLVGQEECDNGSANSSLGPCSLTCTLVLP